MNESVYSNMFARNKIYEAQRKARVIQNAKIAEEQRLKEEEENAKWYEKFGATVLDIFTETGGGLLKLVEGVVDAGAGIAGGVGSIFGADTQWAEDFIKKDYVQELYFDTFEDEATKHSWLNEWDTGKEIIRGIGQQLPTIALIALAPVTGGATLAGVPYTIGATIASAGGQGMEESLNEGATYNQALAYGITQAGIEGAVEAATAGMGKGITTIGKAAGKSVGKTAAKTMGKVMMEEALSEAAEEGISALVNPLSKTIYKGTDALEEYGDKEFYKGVARQAFVGGVVGGISAGAGAITNVKMAGGKTNYSIEQSIKEIKALETKQNNLWNNGKLNAEKTSAIETQRQAEMQNISKQLQSLNAEERAKVISKYNLDGLFDEKGAIISEVNTTEEQNLNEDQNNARKPLISDNIEAYSPSLKNTNLIINPTSQQLSVDAKNAKKFITTLNSNAKIVISDSMPAGVNAFYDTNSKIFYFSNQATAQEIVGHEFTHSIEGTKEYSKLADYILSNIENVDAKVNEKIAKYAEVNKELKQGENGHKVALYEAQTELVAEEMGKILSDQRALMRIVNQNKSVAHRLWQWVKDVVAKLTKKGETGEYYNYIRNAEKLFAKAIQTSYGGASLSDVAKLFEEDAKAELDTNENLRYSKSEKDLWQKLTKQEQAILYENVDELNHQKYYKHKLDNGDYLLNVDNKVVISDGKLQSPSIEGIIEFHSLDNRNITKARDLLYENINNSRTIGEVIGLINTLCEEQVAFFNPRENSKYDSESGRQGQDSVKNRNDNQGKQRRTSSKSVRYSLTQDSQGNTLTEQQAKYFAESQITDKKGNLLVAYHGTDSSFYTFRNMPAQYGRAITDGFYFTLVRENAQKYGKNVKEVYLNIKNPFYLHDGNGVLSELAKQDYTISRLKEEFNLETDEVGLPTPKALKKFLQKLGYDGVVSDTFDGTNQIDTSYSETQIVAFKANQIKEITNKYPTANNDMRYSLKQDNNGNELSEQQIEFFKDSKIRVKEIDGWADTIAEDGNLFEVYHGTNSDEFFEFDKKSIGSANDSGWYGKGFYFAFSESEARYYGSRIMKCYLNIKNPFVFDEQMQQYDGIKDGSITFDFASFVLNMAEKFPKIAETIKADYALGYNNYGESEIAEISFAELAKEIEKLYNSNRLEIVKFTSGDGEFFKYAIRSDIDSLQIDNNVKQLIKDKKIDSPYMAEYHLKNKDITTQEYDKILDVFEKYSRNDLKDQYSLLKYDSIEEAEKDKLSVVMNYIRDYVYEDVEMHMPEYYMQQIGDEFRNEIIKQGYDGVLQTRTGDEVVAFYENQIKLTSNKNPTESNDIRFSLKDGDGDYNYSKGQISKYVAEHSKTKAYARTDAEQIINTIVANQLSFGNKYGEIIGKTKEQAINALWHALNTKNEGYRIQAALDIADYIIDNAIAEDMFQDNNNDYDMFIVGELKNYLRKIDLDSIKGEIRNRFDKDNSPYLLWGKRNGERGLSPDQIAQELEESGIRLEHNNSADIFFEIDSMYRNSLKNLKKVAKEKLSQVLDPTERNTLKQSIAVQILQGYDSYGHKTKFAETIEKYTNKISGLKIALKDANAYNKAKNNAISTIERLRDEFVKNRPAGWKVPQLVVDFVRKITKIETWRNNLSKNARSYISELSIHLESIMDETQLEIYPYKEILKELGNTSKGELTTQELVLLDDVLRQFAWQLRNYDKVSFEGKVQSNTDLATQGVHEIQQAKGIIKDGNKVLIKFKNKVYTNPYDRLAEMGLYRENSITMRIYKDMMAGDSRRAEFVRNANELFAEFGKKNKNYLNSLQAEITIDNDIKMSKRQALSLYMTSLREQGRTHLFNIDESSGVVRLLDNKLSTQGKMVDALAKGKDIRITHETLQNIKNQLTDADLEYLELTKKFFNELSRDAKTTTDEQLYGITNVEQGNYYPLKVSNDKIYTEAGQNNKDLNQYILDMGMNKSVKTNASNKIVIDGIDNVIANHVRNMSLYYGYAIPLTAYNRIMNKQIDVFDTDTTANIRGEIAKIDPTFEGYMNKLWQDIQGINHAEKGFISSILSKIRWAGANSALGANPKVLVTQTLSLASAVSEFNPKHVVKGMAHFFGETHKAELSKYSPLMWERMQIGNSVDVEDIRQVGKEIGNKFGKAAAKATKALNDFTTKPISWMDSNVIQSLWFASQYEIAATKGKGYEFGTELNKIEAGKRLDEVVFRTQQTSDALGRSEWMRSQNEIVKFARMFTGDAIQLTGRLISSVNKYNLARKMMKSGDSQLVSQGQSMLKSSKISLAKAASAFTLNQVMLLAIAMAFKWIKGKEDDEEWSDIARKEATANLMGLIPFGADIYDKWQGYEPTNMAYTALSNTVEIAQELYEGAATLITGDYQDSTKRNAAIRKSVLSMSRLFGLPAQNVESYLKGVVGKISPATKAEYDALFKTESNKTYLERIKKATENGDEELADTIINIMFDSKTGKIKDDKVMETLRDLIEKDYNVIPKSINETITCNGTDYELTKKQYNQFKSIYSQSNDAVKSLVNSSKFNKIDDAGQARAIRFVYDYYYDLAIETTLGEDTKNKAILFSSAIPIWQLALAVGNAHTLQADKDKNGNSITGTRKAKVQSFVQSLSLTAVQKYMIMGYLGYTNSNGASLVKLYINRLNLSKAEKAELYKESGYGE